MLRVGDTFDGGRYSVVAQLGKGTFGRVVQMRDSHRDALSLAVKVVRNVRKYRREAEIEAEILQVYFVFAFFSPTHPFLPYVAPHFFPISHIFNLGFKRRCRKDGEARSACRSRACIGRS